jgi:hypothetical protein
MTTQQFTHAGIAPTPKGLKVRFTNNLSTRVKRLANGNAEFIALPSKMTKQDAANYLLTQSKILSDAAAVSAVQKVIDRFGKEAGSVVSTVTAPAASAKKTSPKAAAKGSGKGAVRVSNLKPAQAAAVEAAIVA